MNGIQDCQKSESAQSVNQPIGTSLKKRPQGVFKDLTGNRYGRLVVVGRAPIATAYMTRFFCICDCGKSIIVRSTHLISGTTKSCGCYMIDRTKETSTTHGHRIGRKSTREYSAWNGMISRTTRSCSNQYKNYGGRGIKVAQEWFSFVQFISDMGSCPDGYTLERKDVNGDYNKENCIWASWKTQQNNRRNNHRIEYSGRLITIAELAELASIKYGCAWHRVVGRGWSAEKTINTPWRENGYHRI